MTQALVQDDLVNGIIQLGDRLSTAELALVNDVIPIGSYINWPLASSLLPSNWLVGTGQNVDRITYGSLFAEYGTTFGVGDGATTFGLPNLPAGSFKPTWTTFASGSLFGTGWADYGGGTGGFQVAGYWKDPLGMVHIRGLVAKASTVTLGETIVSMPSSDYYPATNGTNGEEIFCQMGSVGTTGAQRVDIFTNGNLVFNQTGGASAAYLSLANIQFDSGVLPTTVGPPYVAIKAS